MKHHYGLKKMQIFALYNAVNVLKDLVCYFKLQLFTICNLARHAKK